MKERGVKAEILCFDRYHEEIKNADLLILDVEMPQINGLEIKEMLEHENRSPYIIFVTNHPETVYEAFGRNVLAFLHKPVEDEDFAKVIEKAFRFFQNEMTLPLENGKKIRWNEIWYIRAEHIYTSVMTRSGVYTIRRSLREWEELLKENPFIRVSKECLVNPEYIEEFKGSKVILKSSNEALLVSKRRKTGCIEALQNYRLKMGRFL